MKEKTCRSCKWSGYDRSSKEWWCTNDLSEDFDCIIVKAQEACKEYEEKK